VVVANEPEAARYDKLAANCSGTLAQFNYAFCLAKGRGVPKNQVEAARYYKPAADRNDTDAQYDYSIWLANSRTVVKDEDISAEMRRKWLSSAFVSQSGSEATGCC
jgi:TPR repeat protein